MIKIARCGLFNFPDLPMDKEKIVDERYCAPEVLKKGKIDNKCDIWSFGLLIFRFLAHKLPDVDNIEKSIEEEIKNEDAKDLLKKC